MPVYAFTLLALSLITIPAAAHSGTIDDDAAARVHFERGVQLYREGGSDAALAPLERANELAPNYEILYDIAQVQAVRHEYVEAVRLLHEYLRKGGSATSVERRDAVEDELGKLEQRIGKLSFELDVPGTEVFIDDVSIGSSPFMKPILVNAGTCRVRAQKTGYETVTQLVTVAGTEGRTVALRLERSALAVSEAPSAAPVRTAVSTRTSMAPFWVSFGATVLMGGATAVFGTLTTGKNDDLDRELNRSPARANDVDEARSTLKTFAVITDGFAAATIVAGGVAVYFLVDPPEYKEREASPLSAAPKLAPSPSGMTLSGTF